MGYKQQKNLLKMAAKKLSIIQKYSTFRGFTLAEVLITLGIIGIVAALTIPTLMQNFQDAQYKTGYKKAFSVASQALQSCLTDNEIASRTNQYDDVAAVTNWNCFKSKFNVTKDCSNNNNNLCWDQTGEHLWQADASPWPTQNTWAFVDNSGVSWSRGFDSAGFHGEVYLVDINGFKKPNKYGKDRFILKMCPVGTSCQFDSGIPVKFNPLGDYATGNTNVGNCPSGDCYYQSWIYN